MEFDIDENANFAWAEAFGHKGIGDVNNIADLWSWIRLGYLPLMLQTEYGYSELLGDAEPKTEASLGDQVPIASAHYPKKVPVRGDFLYHNRIVGGIRFRQEVAPESFEHCIFPVEVDQAAAKRWYGKACRKDHREFVIHPEYHHAEGLAEGEPSLTRDMWWPGSGGHDGVGLLTESDFYGCGLIGGQRSRGGGSGTLGAASDVLNCRFFTNGQLRWVDTIVLERSCRQLSNVFCNRAHGSGVPSIMTLIISVPAGMPVGWNSITSRAFRLPWLERRPEFPRYRQCSAQ